MEFLKDIAIPLSLEHFHLVVLIATLSSLVLVPYLGFVLGSSVLSLWYNRWGRQTNNPVCMQFAHELIDIALHSKSLITFLAILPGLSMVLSYSQILQGTPSLGVGLAGFGFLFLLIAMILLYSYKFTFRLQRILGSYQDLLQKQQGKQSKEELSGYQEANTRAHNRSGSYGVVFLFIAIALFAAAVSVTGNPSQWEIDSVLYLVISLDVWMKCLEVLMLSVGITGIGILFFAFAWEGKKEHSEEYGVLVKNIGIRLSILGLLSLPLIVLLNTAVIPDAALSGMAYTLMSTAVVCFFITAHVVYGYFRSPQASALTAGFLTFLLSTAMLLIGDNIGLHTATRNHAMVLASHHEKTFEELKAKYGVVAVTFTGEDIYNAKCSACHLFDQKKVGPPYIETVPKYQGMKAELVAFVLNPVKKDPAYPPMPNQGLRPAEADSIVSYILRRIQDEQTQAK